MVVVGVVMVVVPITCREYTQYLGNIIHVRPRLVGVMISIFTDEEIEFQRGQNLLELRSVTLEVL